MRHFYKHLDLFDKVFIVFVVALMVLTGLAQAWVSLTYLAILLLFVFILKMKDITIEHQRQLLDEVFETLEMASDAIRGRKIVKTTTFSLERVKAKDEKPSNEDKANTGRSRSGSKAKRTSSSGKTTAKSKGTGTASVQNRQSKNSKKNS